jgi:oxepin-CoA hydrolase/3-oxo-5,6-dehydrosuberyl-CoA semialdehyde dehydrogenase
MTDAFANAYGKINIPAQTPEAILPKVRAFALSDTPFKENTKNVLMSETPAALRNNSITEAIWELEKEINAFLDYYKLNPDSKKLNPFFGEFNYQEWLHLLNKHAKHHLTQFNLL